MSTFWGAWVAMEMNIRHPGQLKKNKILGAVLELPAKQHCQFGPFTKKLGAEYLSYVKSIAIYAPQKVDVIIHS